MPCITLACAYSVRVLLASEIDLLMILSSRGSLNPTHSTWPHDSLARDKIARGPLLLSVQKSPILLVYLPN
jgi:hypothetical protein